MDRQIITFEANEQTLIKTGGLDNYSSNKVSYIEAHFALGQNWAGYDSVRAVWSTRYECISTVLDTEGICVVPYEVLKWKDKVMVNLVGSISENDVLTDRITTYPIKALEVDADAKVCGSNTQPITPSEYEQFVEAVKADADRAEDAKEDARGFASSAEISAQNASISETNASTSEDNAKASEDNAETYKNQAQTYAQNANNSAISAENAKDEAEDARDTILGMRAEATTLPEGSSATASYNDGVMSFGIPKGDTGARGATGATGATPQLSIGTVETTAEPSVTITGTDEEPVLNFGLVKGDKGDTGEVSTEQLNEAIENGVTAGANGLVSDSKITEKVPYQFRPTADGVRVGNIAYDKLVGGTVAWNQYIKSDFSSGVDGWQGENGSYLSFSASNGILTATYNGGATASYQLGVRPSPAVVPFVKDHKVLITVDINVSRNAGGYDLRNSVAFGNSNNVTILTNNDAVDTWHRKSKIVNVLGNSDHYAYFLPSGPADNYSQGDTFKFKNHMIIDLTQMFGSTIADYIYSLEQANAGAGVAWFRKFFGEDYYPYSSGELKSVEGLSAHIMRDANNNVVGSYPLDDSLTLRGIPKLDSSNNLYYDGDTYESDGTVTRKYGIVGLGSLTWSKAQFYQEYGFQAYVTGIKTVASPSDKSNLMCSNYITRNGNDVYMGIDGVSMWSTQARIAIYDSSKENLTETQFKTAMSGVYLVYELATPTTETADPYQQTQIVDDFGTEEYVTTSIVPVGHITEYSQDLKGKIEQLPWDFSTLIAPTETSNKASRNYTSGSLLIMNNILYKATANIQSGGTITPNTNVIATTLAEVIASL